MGDGDQSVRLAVDPSNPLVIWVGAGGPTVNPA